MSPELVKPISEAPESNAGDDFHRIWAAKKALELIKFESDGLKGLSIEGAEADEAKEIDETGKKLLSIDLAEYYGDRDFNSAKRVVFSQLKYSTRNSDTSYTAARLCVGKGEKKDRSIIEKLADSFKAYRDKYGRDTVNEKLKVKLVTNRPIDLSLNTDISTIQVYLNTKPQLVNYASLLSKFPDNIALLKKLKDASGLTSQEFTDFLRVLDFSDCGTASRSYQRSILITQLSVLDPNLFKVRFNALYVVVNDMTMPEKRNINSLTIEDMVLIFEMGRIENMFPAPPQLEYIEDQILREQVPALVDAVINSQYPLICLHGEGGAGKSTIVQQLLKELPSGSVAICYDCYGQGNLS